MARVVEQAPATSKADRADLARIKAFDAELTKRFGTRLRVEPLLTRQLVSFQANKQLRSFRWFKYKEAFSAALVEYFIHRKKIAGGPVLDPFAGMGTTLFVAGCVKIKR